MQSKYLELLKPLREVSTKINWNDKDVYANYLAQTFYYVSHSTRLLAAAASRFSQEESHFHRRFLKHCSEENSHEILAKNDLEHLGHDLRKIPEFPETRMFYETQYYKIEHQDPITLLGYILPLEIIACTECPKLYKSVSAKWGEKVATFLKVHGEEDPDHVDKALELLKSLEPKRLQLIDDNFAQTVRAFTLMLLQCASIKAKEQILRSA